MVVQLLPGHIPGCLRKGKFSSGDGETEGSTQIIVFLGMLLNTVKQTVSILKEKRLRTVNALNRIIEVRKVTVLELQKLAGLLNFLSRAIVPSRAFTRRIYAKFANPDLKQHYHVKSDAELKLDCLVWLKFLESPISVSRPFIDFDRMLIAEEIDFFTDAVRSDMLGFRCVFGNRWMYGIWNSFVAECNPSIKYLELYELALVIELWAPLLQNRRFIVFCDNGAVVNMVNNLSTGLVNCMVLIRLIILTSMINNVRFFFHHVRGIHNERADALSKNKLDKFFSLAGSKVDKVKTQIPAKLWPPQKL